MISPTAPVPFPCRFPCGMRVLIGGGAISAVVEEVIFARGMQHPLYLVEWWQDGTMRERRFHECELQEAI